MDPDSVDKVGAANLTQFVMQHSGDKELAMMMSAVTAKNARETKDCIAGFFILVEDQFGIGDVADLGEATGAPSSDPAAGSDDGARRVAQGQCLDEERWRYA